MPIDLSPVISVVIDKLASGGERRRNPAVKAGCFRLGIMMLAVLTAGCAPLPRPFEHDAANELVSDYRALAPLAIRPVSGAPGLDQALVKALEEEEIAATAGSAAESFSVLDGTIETERGSFVLVWRVTGDDGTRLGEARQPVKGRQLSESDGAALAKPAAQQIAAILRGSDSGVTDIEASPHVFLQGIAVPRGMDGDSLARAMSRALAQHGLILDSKSPTYLIAGHMQTAPAGGGQDLVTFDWTVKTADGNALGTVTQASPVEHGRLLGPLTALAREITEAGADGVMEVIRQKGTPASHAVSAQQPRP